MGEIVVWEKFKHTTYIIYNLANLLDTSPHDYIYNWYSVISALDYRG